VKQDKLNGMVEDVVKNVEEVSRRLSDYATKADVASVKDEVKIVRETAAAAASAPPAQATAPAASQSPEMAKLNEQKSEIETMLSTLEENFKTKAMSEEDYNNAKEKNMQKLVEIEKNIKAASPSAGGAGKASAEGEGGHSRVMLLAKLRESYENGELSRAAYQKSRRLLLGKG